MSMIRVDNLTFAYPSSYDEIFKDVSFTIDSDWKLGFVGRNGRGKTTFLNLLLGKYEYQGQIISSVTFDYFPFEVTDGTQLTEDILCNICPSAQEWEFIKELSYLKVDREVLWRPFETLSNGEQTKVLLAALFLKPEHFLLIDEPTNHLDTNARIQIAEYLKKKKGFILVSHDRCLLDECVDHILSLNRSNIEVRSGTFSSWMEHFEKQQQSEQHENERLKKEIVRMKESSKQSENWSNQVEATKRGARDKGYIGHKAAKMMKRAKNIEARKEKAIEEKSKLLKNMETADTLKIQTMEYHKDVLVSYSDVSVSFGKKQICENISFEIKRGERVLLKGKNGSGKSSLLKLLLDSSMEYTGKIDIGSNLAISYIPQDTSFLQGNLKDFAAENHLDESLFKAVLRKLDFERIQFEKDMKDFSAGQKKKVLIAKSLCEPAHLYVWDEPLNYIDVYSRMQIEQLILEFAPAMLIVEHDAVFEEKIGTKIVTLSEQ